MAAPSVLTDLGSLSAKPAGVNTFTTAAIGAGTVGGGSVVVLLTVRRANTGDTTITGFDVTDSAGNTYATLAFANTATGLANANLGGIYFVAGPASIVAASTTFTATAINGTGSGLGGYNLHAFELDSTVQDVGVGVAVSSSSATSAPAATSGTPGSGDYLWLGINGATQASGTTDTISSSGYTLVPTTTTMEGTSGGASTTNVQAKNGYKQVTASAAAETFNGTLSTSSAWLAAVAAVSGSTSPVDDTTKPALPGMFSPQLVETGWF